jgi:hypothetical protein
MLSQAAAELGDPWHEPWAELAEATVRTVERGGESFVGWACSTSGHHTIAEWDEASRPFVDALAAFVASRQLEPPLTDLGSQAPPVLAPALADALMRLPARTAGSLALVDAATRQLATGDVEVLGRTDLPVRRRVDLVLRRLDEGLPLGHLGEDDALAVGLVRECAPQDLERVLLVVSPEVAAWVVGTGVHALEPTSHGVEVIRGVSRRLHPSQRLGFEAEITDAEGRFANFIDDRGLLDHLAWYLDDPQHEADLAAFDRLVGNRGAMPEVARWRKVRLPDGSGQPTRWTPDHEIRELGAMFLFDVMTSRSDDAEAWWDCLAELAAAGVSDTQLVRSTLLSGARGALHAPTESVARTALLVLCRDLFPLPARARSRFARAGRPSPTETRWARLIIDRLDAAGQQSFVDQCAATNRPARRLVKAARSAR